MKFKNGDPTYLVWDANGNLKSVGGEYMLLDGERIYTPLAMMDGEIQSSVRVSDGERARLETMRAMSVAWAPPGMNATPCRPAGVSPLQWKPPVVTDAEAGAQAAQRHAAHAEMVQRQSNAWRSPPANVTSIRPKHDDTAPQSRAEAHAAMVARLSNGWRGGNGGEAA